LDLILAAATGGFWPTPTCTASFSWLIEYLPHAQKLPVEFRLPRIIVGRPVEITILIGHSPWMIDRVQ